MRIFVLSALVMAPWAFGVSLAAGAEKAAVDPDGNWGLHKPLKGCFPCHGNRPKPDSIVKPNMIASVPQLCYTCHKEHTNADGWKHGPVATGECLLCHQTHHAGHKPLLSKAVPQLCHHCHEQKLLGLIANHAEKSHANCTDCHEAHVSPGRMLLKKTFLESKAGRAYMSKSPAATSRPVFIDSRGSPGGPKGIRVVPVLNGPKSPSRYGVSEKLVRTKVEQHLRRNGIKTLSDREHKDRNPVLHVQVRLMEVPSMRPAGKIEAISGSINIYLLQAVELLGTDRRGSKRFCSATTWNTGTIVIWAVTQVEEGFDKAVKVLVDQFGKDYLDANSADPAPK